MVLFSFSFQWSFDFNFIMLNSLYICNFRICYILLLEILIILVAIINHLWLLKHLLLLLLCRHLSSRVLPILYRMTVDNFSRFIVIIIVQLIRLDIIILIVAITYFIKFQYLVVFWISGWIIAFGWNRYLNIALQMLRSLGWLTCRVWLLLNISIGVIFLTRVEQFSIIRGIFGGCVSSMLGSVLCNFGWAIWFNDRLISCWSL